MRYYGANATRVARALFWVAALSFGSMGIVWSVQSQGYSIATQMIVAAFCAGLAAAALVWGLHEIGIKNEASADEPRSHGAHGTKPIINVYNAPVTHLTQTFPPEIKLAQVNPDDKRSPSISIQNAPGSIIAPSGGNNVIPNQFGPQPRQLDSAVNL